MANTYQEYHLTKEQALFLYESKWWEGKSDFEIAFFQLFINRLCMDFGRFHEAVEKALGRSVWTHEFAYADGLRAELLKEREAPTFAEIMDLIPEEKRVLVVKV